MASTFRLLGNVSVKNGVGIAEIATVGLPAHTISSGRFANARMPLDPSFGGTMTVQGDILPAANVTYDLGSASMRWKDLYLSGNTIVLGNTFIREGEGESVQLGGSSTTVAAEAFAGNGAALTSLNASELTTGTVPDAAITGSYTGMTNLTGSGTVDFSLFLGNAADSATAPSFSWTGDTNTGMYTPGADQVALTTNGVARLYVDATGNVGIGTTSPAQQLTLRSTAPTILMQDGDGLSGFIRTNGNKMFFLKSEANDGTTFDTARPMTIDLSNSRVGISNESPAYTLDVSGDARVTGSYRGSSVYAYGSMTVAGSKENYAGIAFSDYANVLMVGAGASGIWNNTSNAWQWYFTNTGVLTEGTVPAARITAGAFQAGNYSGMTNLTGTGNVDFSKFLGLATDTAAAPSFTWTGDTTTGIFRPATNQIGFSTAGTQRLHILTNTSSTHSFNAGFDGTAFTAGTNGFFAYNTGPTSFAYMRARIVPDATLVIDVFVGGARKFSLTAAGTLNSVSGSLTGHSDIKLKRDVIDAHSQWEDLKKFKWRRYRLKNEVEEHGDAAKYYLGVIVQEIQDTSPHLVDAMYKTDEEHMNTDEIDFYTVNYGAIWMKSAACLKEAILRIEALETENAALKAQNASFESRLAALENNN